MIPPLVSVPTAYTNEVNDPYNTLTIVPFTCVVCNEDKKDTRSFTSLIPSAPKETAYCVNICRDCFPGWEDEEEKVQKMRKNYKIE